MTTQERFDGLAFPVITVRLGNGAGRGTMVRDSETTIRARVSYSYDQRDGAAFALTVAQAVWAKWAERMRAEHGIDDSDVVFIPGDIPTGYSFTAVPSRFFA